MDNFSFGSSDSGREIDTHSMMGDWAFNVENIVALSATDNELSQLISPYLAKQMWSSNDRKKLLNGLANMFLYSPNKTSIVNFAHALGPIMQDVLQRCMRISAEGGTHIMDNFKIMIGELIRVNFPNFLKFLEIGYFLEHCVSARSHDFDNCPTKKPRISNSVSINAGLCSIAQIVRNIPSAAVRSWPWNELLRRAFQARNDLDAGGVNSLTEIISFILQLKRSTMEAMKLQESASDLDIRFENCARQYHCQLAVSKGRMTVSNEKASYTKRALTCSDFSENVVVAAGVMIQNQCQESINVQESDIVITESIQRCLHSIALGIANGHPIMLLGSAGCGKTTLLRHFAKSVVKKKLIEVQLGDGVDSKVLSGIYKCTAVSGEFEWQPGVLAQAVQNGDWVILEDIDKAPLDVISLLLPLLESRTTIFPGHSHMENDTSNSSGFRLFMTCRTSMENHSPNAYVTKLMHHSRCIRMDAFSDKDLKLIIETKFPELKTVSEKLLEIYKTVRDTTFVDFSFDSRACKRSISVRDLLRFCGRIPSHMINKEPCDLGQAVASEAVDCLVASTISNEERKQKIQTIFALLNLSTSNVEYFWQSYKPEILFRNGYANMNRVSLPIKADKLKRRGNPTELFALNRSSSILVERLACAVQKKDPVLLVGETGVGKTTGIQFLADKLGCTLHIVNISQQSSSSDLLGSFKPIQRKHLIAPVRDEFEKLFVETFSKHQNDNFLSHIQVCYLNKRYNYLLKLFLFGCKQALKKGLSKKFHQSWQDLNMRVIDLNLQIKVQESVAFSFVEGILSKALKDGDWLLLDEINLASPEALDCLSSVLESDEGSVSLLEIGDTKPINRHPDFRIFAAMNPATDVGKRNLPNNIRSRFLEIFVSEPIDDADLLTIIGQYLKRRHDADNAAVTGVLKFYRQICRHSFHDGSSLGVKKPLYSLRSLCRALRYVMDNPKMNLYQALFEGLCLAFMTEINHTGHEAIVKLVLKTVVGTSRAKSVVSGTLPRPLHKHVTVKGYHIKCGSEKPYSDEKYIMTPHIEKNLKVLSRAVSYGKYPVLIQGETSTGKTSMINYLATLTGNKVFRINNHEHTDLQEYIGTYSSDSSGKFYFQEGPLVTAMREGHWIILDELNLAPTDILESLNRVLDDNRELFIPETQETVIAHPRFALFATQNPPGLYGGRKVLSRALRNRFIELHFGQIPSDEITTILHRRCDLPMSRCKKLINVMEDLQEKRSASGIFAGKHSYITLRDLFRWAERYRRGQSSSDSPIHDWDQQLANDGFMLLAGKVRTPREEVIIQESIEKYLKKKIKPDEIFGQRAVKSILKEKLPNEFDHIVFTSPLRKLVVMLHRALMFDEPVLLVGGTGCGKTTACQLVSALLSKGKSQLSIINCHSHTDASDFLGGLRPVRHNTDDDGVQNRKLFEWVDGPLVRAMHNGSCILVDEISLAEDAVLERLNSVLEPARTLVIPDRVSSEEGELDLTIQAQRGFQFMATMNPGGDFGKKELSPALRNRLTEIWCTAVSDNLQEVTDIVKHNLAIPDHFIIPFSEVIVKFISWFTSTTFGSKDPRSIRDIMKWVWFCNTCCKNSMDATLGLIHGALLAFIDGIGSGISDVIATQSKEARVACLAFILNSLKEYNLDSQVLLDAEKQFESMIHGCCDYQVSLQDGHFVMEPFRIPLGSLNIEASNTYSFNAPSTSMNLFRLMRALQSSNPILLEGSPGIGKTSLVMALARATGHDIVRINLSEQTDITDLLGADLPVEDGVGGQFSWRDGPLLTALKNGAWVVFDELNLASQSVLEGLNSVFDHRNEIFVPELGVTFNVKCDETRIFACQNPYYQGGGRKGLPKSFLNRFNQVYMEPLSETDMVMILSSQFPSIPMAIIEKMVQFNEEVKSQVVERHQWGHAGSPWEFNLRDLTRWCELVVSSNDSSYPAALSMYLIYCERLQKYSDREKMCSLYSNVFEMEPYQPTCNFHLSSNSLIVGNAILQREFTFPVPTSNVLLLPSMLHSMESMMAVLQQGWMTILTGGSGCGKTTLVETLAALVGKKLRIFAVNSSMDATELLGGFEQIDFLRHLTSVPNGLIQVMMEYCNSKGDLLSESGGNLTVEILGSIQDINNMKLEISQGTDVGFALNCGRKLQCLLDALMAKCQGGVLPCAISASVQKHQVLLAKVIRKIEQSRGKFEWVDSELVEALKAGDWLLVEGANLCNPSVLDRLNALLEPSGTLTVTERGVIDGSFVEITPHPSFRIILSLDTSEGNLSRAMRNRGVEIHMLSADDNLDANSYNQVAMCWSEVERIVDCILSYCPASVCSQVRLFLFQIFRSGNMKINNTSALMFNCLRSAQELSEAIAAGDDVKSSLLEVGTRYLDKEFVENVLQSIYESMPDGSGNARMPIVRLNNIIHDTTAAMVFQQGQYFNEVFSSLHRGRDVTYEAICYFLRLATQTDWEARIKYVGQFVLTDLKDLRKFRHALKCIMTSSHYAKFIERNELLARHSWDFGMNEQLLKVSNVSLSSTDAFICANTCLLLFVTKLQNFELDQELHALAALYNSNNTSTKRKSKRRKLLGKSDAIKVTGPLVLSYLYHDGVVKSQQLPDPCYVYLLPLYQTIFSYLYECIHVEIHLQYKDWFTIKEKIIEICQMWWSTLRATELGTKHVMMSIRKIQKAFLCIANLYNMASKTVSITQHKMVNLFQSINDSLSANWDILRFQNKVRMSHSHVRLGAATFKSEEEFRVYNGTIDLIQKIALTYQGDRRALFNEQAQNMIFTLCKVWSDAISSQTFCEKYPDYALIESLNAELGKASDDVCIPDDQRQCELQFSKSLSEIARNFMLTNLLDILMFSEKVGLAKRVDYFCEKLRDTPLYHHIINANSLLHIMCLNDLSEKTLKDQQHVLIGHLLSAVMTLFNEGSLSDVINQKSNCVIGASAVLKPSRCRTILEAICSQPTKQSKNSVDDVPMGDLSANSLTIWNDVSLPLFQYGTYITLLKSLNLSLWKESFHTPRALYSMPHENITKCFCIFLHYMCNSFNMITNINGMPDALYDIGIHDTLRSFVKEMLKLRSTLFPAYLVDSIDVLSQKMLEGSPIQDNNSEWLKDLRSLLINALLNAYNAVKHLNRCKDSKIDTEQKGLQIISYLHLGMSWVGMSAINYQLISPQTDLDPVQFNDFKCDLLKYQLSKLESDMEAYSMYLSTSTGHSLFDDSNALCCNNFIHPLIPLQHKKIGAIQDKLSSMKSMTAYRPPEKQFKELVQICRQTGESFMSVEANEKMFQNMIFIFQQMDFYNFNFKDDQLKSDVNKLCRIRASLTTFAKEISKFTGFPDFCNPLLDSVNHFCMGSSVVENALNACLTMSMEMQHTVTIDNLFSYLMSIKNHCQPLQSIQGISEELVGRLNESNLELNANKLTEDVLSTLLLKLRNIVIFEGVSSGQLQYLKKLLDYVVTELDKQQQAEIRKKEEKASLYKTKRHLEDLDEKQLENEQFFRLFGYNPESDEDQPTQEANLRTEVQQLHKYSENLGKIAMRVHTDICGLTGITNTEHSAKSTCDLPVDFSLPSLYATNKLHMLFMSNYDGTLNIGVDENLLNANLSAVHHQIKMFESDFSNKDVTCNIYRDPSVSEAKCCLPVIDKLVEHVNTVLLIQWPDNPMLLKILEVCERIKNFSVASPLMKFVTGMETLLDSVQEWEKNACGAVSLKEFMSQIIQLIFKWRKMELSNWGRLIDDRFQKLSYIQPSMYFSLYQLVCSEFDESTIKDLITQLENFMESSTLSQFCPRLDVLATFRGHLNLCHKRDIEVDKVFKNVHLYYSQFKTLVIERMQAIRKPIEKDLKEFVSITRWNDSNFFAMKNSVKKGHAQLFNLIKKFSLAMQEKVRCNVLIQGPHSTCFTVPPAKMLLKDAKVPALGKEILNEDSMLFAKCSAASSEFPVLCRLPTFAAKFRKICTDSCFAIFESHITSVEDSISEIIDTAQQLRDAQPTTIAKTGDDDAKAKRISEAKNIKLRKQKALTDLFKYLSEIGLSYRKGLASNKVLTSQELLLTDVPNNATGVTVFASPGNVKVEVSTGGDQERDYFYQIILKWSCMIIVSGAPHKDLNKSALDRCVGFVGNLMNLSVSQRQLLSRTINSRHTTEEAMKTLTDMSQATVHSDQSTSYQFISCSTKVVNKVCCLLEEFVIWMECCPDDAAAVDSLSRGNSDANSVKQQGINKGSSAWSNVLNSLRKVLDEGYGIKNVLDAIIQSKCELSIVSTATILQIKDSLLTLQLSLHHFVEFSLQVFQEGQCSFTNMPKMVSRCVNLSTEVKSFIEEYGALFAEDPQTSKAQQDCETALLHKTESLVSALLVAIQEFKKIDSKHDGDDVLRWTNKLIVEQITKMSVGIVNEEVKSFTQLVIANIPHLNREFMQSTTRVALLLLQDYQALLRRLETILRKVNRTTMKLCYVLGGMFLQLCKDGYCTPEDVKEEVDEGEGAELEDAEGGGVGEGEGSNDVSDQIEDQEMLEDKPGEEDDGENKDIEASENAVEMDNDFEGQFDDNDDREEKNDEQSDQEEEQDIEKQMGDLGHQQNQEKLDEQFWGSDEEPEEEEQSKEDSTENGPGVDQSQQELAPNDDSTEDEHQQSNEENEKPNDESEFNPSETDPYADNEDEKDEQENLNLPEDFNIDNDQLEDDAEEDDNTEETDNTEEATDPTAADPAGDEEQEMEAETSQAPMEEDEQGEDNDQEEEPVDMDAQDPLNADEALNKDESNTINDVTSNDQKMQHDEMKSENPEPNDNNVPPPDSDKTENENDGVAPVKDLDDKSAEYSRVKKDDKSQPDNNLPNKKQESKSRDHQDVPNDKDSTIEERLNIVDPVNTGNEQNEFTDEMQPKEAEAYEHVSSATEQYDKRVFDSADQEVDQIDVDTGIEKPLQEDGLEEIMDIDDECQDVSSDKKDEKNDFDANLSRSEIHTNILATLNLSKYVKRSEEEVEQIRKKLEETLQLWRNNVDPNSMRDAEAAWENYCYLTRSLSIELCEQLRLVLEPTEASQLKGDYRTGKRLNIRKMIPYIASGYRKDKIWLRRTKPNKRTYQVMLAIDDSSSMVDNHTKQLAFESAAVISSALLSLEVGQFAVSSFGEDVELLQNFGETFTTKSGASFLRRCTFSQKKTKIAKFLDYSTDLFRSASKMNNGSSNDISQLLLIISDGRGLYLEGRKRVLESVNAIQQTGVFVVFVILDQPNHGQGSISDIKVPVFDKAGQMPVIHSYMKDFPFPFYVILRDINVLPQTLGEALRQWFVLVTSSY